MEHRAEFAKFKIMEKLNDQLIPKITITFTLASQNIQDHPSIRISRIIFGFNSITMKQCVNRNIDIQPLYETMPNKLSAAVPLFFM